MALAEFCEHYQSARCTGGTVRADWVFSPSSEKYKWEKELFEYILSVHDSVLATTNESWFAVTDWPAPVDLGTIATKVVSHVLTYFIMSDAFISNNSKGVWFPSAPKNVFLVTNQERLMKAFRKCLFWFIFYH